MSWFSDFAKTALNEAQKRIDKVLDIEEDETTKNESSNKLQTEQSMVSPRISMTNQNNATSVSTKLGKNVSSNKKARKPTKLGSSLSKRNVESKLNKGSIDEPKRVPSVDSFQIFHNISLEENDSSQMELNTSNLNSISIANGEANQNQALSVSDNDFSSPIGDNKSVPKKSLPVVGDCKINNEPPEIEYESPAKKTSPSREPKEKVFSEDLQFFSGTAASPCGSTTTSSEIEILDHESNVSEASAALKLPEYDNRLHMMSTDPTTRSVISPDAIESEGASDIGRVSACCSSPLSLGSNDGAAVSNLQQNLSLKIENDVREDEQNLSVDFRDENDEFPTPGDSKEIDLKISDDVDDHVDESEIDSVTENRRFETDTEKQTTDPPNIINTCEDDGLISPVVVVPSVLNFDDQVNSNKEFVPDRIPTPSLPDTSNHFENVMPQPQLSRDDDLTNQKFQAYEQQLLTVSLSNAKLNEENDNLRSELTNLKAKQEEEFDKRQQNVLSTIENLSQQIQELELDKSEIANQLISAQSELSTRLTNEQVQNLITEKEESIQGLLEEGEALSKQHLQLNNTIKKLRTKLTDKESSLKDVNSLSDKLKEENKTLKSRLTQIEGRSSEDRGAAKRLSEAYQEREAELNSMKNKLEDAEEKKRAAQSTLDAAYKDLADLNKKLVALQSDREAELKESEATVSKRLQQEVAMLQQDHEHQLHMNVLQMGELRDALERNEAIFARKEDQLRKEIRDLQQRLQESEMRNQELSESISESTRPILRQMENLQSTYSSQAKTWEALEKNLTSRLGEAQVQLVASQEKERFLQLSLVDLKSRVASLEQRLSESNHEKLSLDTEIKQLREDATNYDANLTKLRSDLMQSEANCEEIKTKCRRDRLTLENQLDMEKVRAEVEKKKFASQLEVLQKEKERLAWMNRTDSVVSSASALVVDSESVASSNDTFNTFDVFERQQSNPSLPTAVYDSVRSGSNNSALMENLQSQIKMRDGEIQQLQGEINTLERTRSSMAEEIVRLTNENEDLNETTKDVENLKQKLKEVQARYDAVLTMYGEKAEEADELRLDLQDVKAMYRNQIDALMKAQ